MAVDVSGLVAAVEDYARNVVAQAAPLVLEAVKADCPVSVETPTTTRAPGNLRDSFEIVDTLDASPLFGASIATDVDYASFTDEQDTDPHIIAARFAPMLRFWWENGPRGADIYHYKFVRHPGTKGQHWFASKNEGRWQDALEQVAG